MSESKTPAGARLALVALLAAQLFWLELAVLTGSRFANAPIPSLLAAAVLAIPFAAGIWLLVSYSVRTRNLRTWALVAALLVTARFHAPGVFSEWFPPFAGTTANVASGLAPDLVRLLREIAAAQEQHRRRTRRYAQRIEDLTEWVPRGDTSRLSIIARGDTGWAATVDNGATRCSMWVRDTLLRRDPNAVEGSPFCGAAESRAVRHRIGSVIVPPVVEQGFSASETSGDWLQHRGSANRTGATSGIAASSYSWQTRIGGQLRASPAIAGGQVFIGAHGNGEIAALSLATGRVGFRLRAPNWIHHEPAVSGAAMVFGFGNNEPSHVGRSVLGSQPSGIVAYDRRTGAEYWRHYTEGSVMNAPVIWRDVVASPTGSNEAIGLALKDGRVLWRTELPDHSPMGNAALVDSTLLVGVEPATVCALNIATGQKLYCKELDKGGWGAGHASIAVAGDVALQVYEADRDGSGGTPDGPVMATLRRVVGMPPKRHRPRPPTALREQVMVALNWRDGTEIWRVGLGPGRRKVDGHIAGTPVIVAGVAYVPSPTRGAVVAVDVSSGRVIWSAPVVPSRGSVSVLDGRVFAATSSGFVVLDARTGSLICRQVLPAGSDRAALTVSGGTGVLELLDGTVIARPVTDWLTCRA